MATGASMSVSNELQGIGSVLGCSEYQRSKTAASLRRTLSADMSSKKWLSKNGFCPLKRIASSEDIEVAVNEDDSKSDIPSRVGEKSRKEEEPPGQSDIWASIMSEKSSSVPATTYVHPLAKRTRSLNQKSLEICTESLGSETGSDGFSSPPSQTSDDDEQQGEAPVVRKQEFGVVNYNSYAVKKSPSRSFPPPLSSLSQSGLQVRSHRIDCRLVLEAVPLPLTSNNYCFEAQRQGGRLLLTIANTKYSETTNIDNTKESGTNEDSKLNRKALNEEEEEEEEAEYIFQQEEDAHSDSDKEEYEEEDSEEENEQVMERGIVLEMKVSQPTKMVPTGVINVHRSALMVNKLMGLTNIDPTWSSKLEKLVDLGDEQTLLAQSLPPLANRLIPAASPFNTYNYCWRTKSAAPTVRTHPLTNELPPINKSNKFLLLPKNLNPKEEQELVLKRGNKLDYSVQFFKGCKEPRRTLSWEPHCIATS